VTEAPRSADDGTSAGGGTILVTGAAGFLGSRVVTQLSAAGWHQVIATDVVRSATTEQLAALPGVEFRVLDLRDHAALEGAVADTTHIVHLAAVRSQTSQEQPRLGFEVNVAATHDLMTLAGTHRTKAFVYGSSHLVYGAFQDPHRAPFTEEEGAVGSGLSLYAAAKLACEALMEPIALRGGFAAMALRFGGIYGPGAAPGSNSSEMLAVLDAIDRGERPAISWTPETVHALIYVDDAARAVVKAVDRATAAAAINVVGHPVRCREIYTSLVRLCGHDPELLEWPSKRARYQLVSDERLHSVLDCAPATSLDDGLRSIIAEHTGASR
jgi:UDP-glucose 4-epimerase